MTVLSSSSGSTESVLAEGEGQFNEAGRRRETREKKSEDARCIAESEQWPEGKGF